MTIDPLPVPFRYHEIHQILQWLDAGDSCQVFGIGSVGKSNLLRHLLRPEVIQAHLSSSQAPYLFVYIDSNKMIEQSTWGLFELMMHQLLIELINCGAELPTLAEIDELHERLVSPEYRPFAIRYLERSFVLVCNRLGYRLVLILDDLHLLIHSLPGQVFASLRALRDEFKYRLMFLVAARRPLNELAADPAEIEPFVELLSHNTLWLNAYAEADAGMMLARLAARNEAELTEAKTRSILELSGGHPGLIQALFKHYLQDSLPSPESLQIDPGIQDECQRIWDSIPTRQQQDLLSLAADPGLSLPDDELAALNRMGLWLCGDSRAAVLFSPLFQDFLDRRQPAAGVHITIDPARRLVWVDGRKVSDLTRLEYKMLEYLVLQRGQVCSRDDIARHMYPKDMALDGAGVSENRLDSVAKRLRSKIEQNPDNPAYIQTIRGVGFQLTDGEHEP
jgi:DNA-binding winged helix-turn-helix (wHTH) protein